MVPWTRGCSENDAELVRWPAGDNELVDGVRHSPVVLKQTPCELGSTGAGIRMAWGAAGFAEAP